MLKHWKGTIWCTQEGPDITKCHLCLLQPSHCTINTSWHLIVSLPGHQRKLLLKVCALPNAGSQHKRLREHPSGVCLDVDALAGNGECGSSRFRVDAQQTFNPVSKKQTIESSKRRDTSSITMCVGGVLIKLGLKLKWAICSCKQSWHKLIISTKYPFSDCVLTFLCWIHDCLDLEKIKRKPVEFTSRCKESSHRSIFSAAGWAS